MDIDLEFISKVTWVLFIVLWAVIRYKPNRKSRKVNKTVTSRNLKERF